MSAQTDSGSADVHTTPTKINSVYTVQAARRIEAVKMQGDDSPAVDTVWVDIATVTVPHRTPRKIVFRRALKQAELKPTPDAEPLRLRALDAASAADMVVPAVQPDPEWVI